MALNSAFTVHCTGPSGRSGGIVQHIKKVPARSSFTSNVIATQSSGSSSSSNNVAATMQSSNAALSKVNSPLQHSQDDEPQPHTLSPSVRSHGQPFIRSPALGPPQPAMQWPQAITHRESLSFGRWHGHLQASPDDPPECDGCEGTHAWRQR